MPVTLIMISRGEFLVPAWPQDEEEMERIPQRQALTVTVSRTAPSKLKAFYRALLSRLVGATNAWPSVEQCHRQLLFRCGFFESALVTDFGDIRFTPPSTRDWDAFQWRSYLDALWPVLINEIVPEIPEAHLRDGIKAMIGLDLEEAMKP